MYLYSTKHGWSVGQCKGSQSAPGIRVKGHGPRPHEGIVIADKGPDHQGPVYEHVNDSIRFHLAKLRFRYRYLGTKMMDSHRVPAHFPIQHCVRSGVTLRWGPWRSWPKR